MAEDITQKILLELNLNSENTKQSLDDTIKKIVDYSEATRKLQDNLAALTKAGKQNSDEYKNTQRAIGDNSIAVKALTKDARNLEGQLVNLQKANVSETGSLVQKRSALNAASAEYARYSAEQKKTDADAIALGKSILNITNELKSEEKSLGDNRRNVGNYAAAIKEASNELQGIIRTMGAQSDEAIKSRVVLSKLKEEYSDFNKTTSQFDGGNNFTSLANSTSDISSGLSQGVTELKLFGGASDSVSGSLSSVGSGIGVIATAPAILKDAKIAMASFTATTGVALAPLLVIAAAIAAIAISVSVFNSSVDDADKKLTEFNENAKKLKEENDTESEARDLSVFSKRLNKPYSLKTIAATLESLFGEGPLLGGRPP